MSRSGKSLLERRVAMARRRMVLQSFVNRICISWIVGAVAMLAWVLVRPFIFNGLVEPWMDWTAGGIFFGLATVAALVQSIRKAPTAVEAALTLDQRFELRERVTTTLVMSEREQQSSVGAALRSDAEKRVASIQVGSKFPVRLGWTSAIIPALGVALALLFVFYDPVIPPKETKAATTQSLPPEIIKEIEQKKREYLQKPKADPKQPERLKSDETKRIEAQVEEILKRPATTAEELKDRLAEITNLEEDAKKRQREEAERVQGFQDQMQKLDQLMKKNKADGKDQNGATKDLKDQLAKGDTEKAKNEAERLSKKIKDGDLINKKDKEQLANELKDLKDDLERLSREKEKEDEEKRQEKEKQLKEQFKDGKIDKEQLDREMNKLNEERKKTSDTQELADKLAKAQKSLEQAAKEQGEGNNEKAEQQLQEAAKQLQEAADQLQQMENREKALEDLDGELQRMSGLREELGKACDKCRNPGADDAETLNRNNPDGEGKDGKDGNGSKPGQGKKGGKGLGRRPENKSGDSKATDAKQRAQFDTKGKKIHVGTAEGKSIIGKTGASIDGEIKQAAQENPDAIEAQRVPRGYKDSVKGFIKNLGNQQTGPNVPKK